MHSSYTLHAVSIAVTIAIILLFLPHKKVVPAAKTSLLEESVLCARNSTSFLGYLKLLDSTSTTCQVKETKFRTPQFYLEHRRA